jgi:hypothetical protein
MEHLKLILILKEWNPSGIYLKWFNANGGYSYWLFDKFYSDTTSTKTIDEIVGKYDNLKTLIHFQQ